MCYDGVWGVICTNRWAIYYFNERILSFNYDTVADVICRQLGQLQPNTSIHTYTLYSHKAYCNIFHM